MASTECHRIADQLERALAGPAWHGPSTLDTLAGVTAAAARARPVPGAHSIWEIVNHTAAWLEIVEARLAGAAPSDITPDMDWPPPGGSDADWQASVAGLKRAAAALRAAVLAFDDGDLGRDLPGIDDTWSAYHSLHGVVQHVLYHAGQIAILRKGAAKS